MEPVTLGDLIDAAAKVSPAEGARIDQMLRLLAQVAPAELQDAVILHLRSMTPAELTGVIKPLMELASSGVRGGHAG